MSFILALETALPPYRHAQSDILAFMQKHTLGGTEKSKRLLSVIYKKSGINFRHSVLPDFSEKFGKTELFTEVGLRPSLEKRMELFEEKSRELMLRAAKKCLGERPASEITHIITVSCTGFSAPGSEIFLCNALKLSPSVYRQSVNFMGCYAAFTALRQADDICRNKPESKVLIVDIELCTLHFQNEADADNLMANALFSDGCAAVLVGGKKENTALFALKKFRSRLIPAGESDMSWKISSTGFLMTLSSYVPDLLQNNLAGLLEKCQNDFNSKTDFFWAVHPGGRRILDKIKDGQSTEFKGLQASYETLADNGNMSSVTILFLLKNMISNYLQKKEEVLALGFGPGLTMESMLLETVSPEN